MKLNNLIIAAALACGLGAPAAPSSIKFSYADLEAPQTTRGTMTAETYDVAVRLDGSLFAGKRLTAVSVPLPGGSDISSCRVWLSKALAADMHGGKSVNRPDLLSVPAKVKNDRLELKLPESYAISADGVYVGYTFTVDAVPEGAASGSPVVGVEGTVPGGLYIHTSKTNPVWGEGGAQWNLASALTLTIEGEFPALDLRVLPDAGSYNVKAGEAPLPVQVQVANRGTAALTELTFAYSVAGQEGTVTCTPGCPLRLQWGIFTPLELSLPVSLEKGRHEVSLTLRSANGKPAESKLLTATAGVDALEYVPEHRPLMEEFTGLWCGACPRGLAAMQYMEKKWPGRFIALSYHSGDDMEVMESADYPLSVASLPSAWLDRGLKIDPYHGTGTVGFGLEQAWLAASARFTPADVSVTADWTDEAHTAVAAKATVKFIKAVETPCRVEYTLLADGLSDPAWIQSNYYSGREGYDDLEEMRPFVEGQHALPGLTFDGVVVATSRLDEAASGAFEPKPDTPRTVAYTFCLTDLRSLTGCDLAAKAKTLRVVASVVDAVTGRVLNSAIATVGVDPAAVTLPAAPASGATEYYDLQGIRLRRAPAAGPYITRIPGAPARLHL